MTWRGKCLQCGKRALGGQTYCRKHMNDVRVYGCSDRDEFPTEGELRRALYTGAGTPWRQGWRYAR